MCGSVCGRGRGRGFVVTRCPIAITQVLHSRDDEPRRSEALTAPPRRVKRQIAVKHRGVKLGTTARRRVLCGSVCVAGSALGLAFHLLEVAHVALKK